MKASIPSFDKHNFNCNTYMPLWLWARGCFIHWWAPELQYIVKVIALSELSFKGINVRLQGEKNQGRPNLIRTLQSAIYLLCSISIFPDFLVIQILYEFIENCFKWLWIHFREDPQQSLFTSNPDLRFRLFQNCVPSHNDYIENFEVQRSNSCSEDHMPYVSRL